MTTTGRVEMPLPVSVGMVERSSNSRGGSNEVLILFVGTGIPYFISFDNVDVSHDNDNDNDVEGGNKTEFPPCYGLTSALHEGNKQRSIFECSFHTF